MAFIRKQGRTKLMWLPVTASTAFVTNSLVEWESGKLKVATNDGACHDMVGVLRHAITSGDPDYADDRLVEVEVPVEMNTVWEADVTADLVAGDIGGYFDLTDAVTVNRGASTYDIVQCVGVISGTKGLFHLHIGHTARVKA